MKKRVLAAVLALITLGLVLPAAAQMSPPDNQSEENLTDNQTMENETNQTLNETPENETEDGGLLAWLRGLFGQEPEDTNDTNYTPRTTDLA